MSPPVLLLLLLSLVSLSVVRAEVLQLSAHNFMSVVDGPHHKIVKFFAPWCEHCKQVEPFFLATSAGFPTAESNIVFAQVDTDEEGVIADELAISHYPTFLFFPEGDADAVEEIPMGSSLLEMYSVLNHRFGFTHRLPVPEVPHLVTQLSSEESFFEAVVSRTGFLAVNIYGESCPSNCYQMHRNLPRIAQIFQNEDITFARIHGEDHPALVRRFKAIFYPALVIFPKLGASVEMYDNATGDYTFHTYSDAAVDPVALLEHLNDIMGTARDEQGGLLMEAGNIPELDAIVRASTSLLDPSLHTQLQAAVAQLPPHDDSVYRYPDMSGMYVRTAERVRERVSKGVSAEQWVTSEVLRLQEALLQEDVQADERDDLHLALNVLRVFGEKVPQVEDSEDSDELGEL